jgi:2-oxoglutarate/2-oxoacid ferredoxin oxidoreductase subunit alpha
METDARTGPALMTGNEAVAHAAMKAGLTFFAGYPITPSTEIAEALSAMLPRAGGVFVQMEDEIAAMSAIIGGSLAGAKTLTATSGPGFSLKQEAIGYACVTEVPCVIVNVMRGGPSTGLPTLPAQGDIMQARWGTHGDHPVVAYCPERVEEAYRLTLKCFDIAERLRTPVMLLMDEIVGHVTERIIFPVAGAIDVCSNRETELSPEDYRPYAYDKKLPPPLVPFGKGYRYHVTGLLHDETGFPSSDTANGNRELRWLMDKVENNRDMIIDIELVDVEDADILLFAYGASARSAKGAMRLAREEGLKVGLFRPRSIWPFAYEELKEAAKNVKAIISIEMNLGQLTNEVKLAVEGQVPVVPFFKVGGEPVLPAEILDTIKGV